MHYILGIDGGGTKTEYALFDLSGQVLFSYCGSGSNHEGIDNGIPGAADILCNGIYHLLRETNLSLSQIQKTSIGLAGMDHPEQIDKMKTILSSRNIPNPVICNDGFLIIKAGSPTGTGIGYNAGTGTCCNGIDATGGSIQLGGFGEYSGDIGNANWNAMRTFCAIYDDVVLKIKSTLLTDLYFERFQIHNVEEFISSVSLHQGFGESDYVPFLNNILFTGIHSNDIVSLEILDQITDRASDFIACIANSLVFEEDCIPVILSGSVHKKQDCSIYKDNLHKKSELKSGKRLEFSILNCNPIQGTFFL